MNTPAEKRETPTYKEAYRRALNIACHYKKQAISPCHLFAATVSMAKLSKGIMREIMLALDIDPDELEKSIMIDAQNLGKQSDDQFSTPEMSSAATKIRRSSVHISESLGHSWIGAEHVFLALCRSNAPGVGKHVKRMNLTYSRVLDIVQTTLATTPKSNRQAKSKGTVANKSNQKSAKFLEMGRDLSELAALGKLDGAGCREDIVEEMIIALGRKTKSCPMLIGDPGVGKTACVEELAIAIKNKDVHLKNRIFSCEIGKLVAGTKLRGQFEERLKELLSWAESEDVIIFIDEAHTMISAGGGDGALNVSNILKPYLARGAKFIFATTLDEYRKYIEKDAALERRMAVINVPEMSCSDAARAIWTKISVYEQHHGVSVLREHVDAAVRLAKRYMPSRRLPDSAIDLIDESMAGVAIRRGSEMSHWDLARTTEMLFGAKIEDVDAAITAEERVRKKVVGQDSAVSSLVSAWRRRSVGISDARRPIGSFLLVGESGCGITTIANAIASECFEGRSITVDMSELQSDADISKIIGAPPGYVGYENGGKLVNYVRRNPRCLVILDKIQFANPRVLNVLLQAMEEGQITDGSGKIARLNESMILMTASMKAPSRTSIGFGASQDTEVKFDPKKILSPELINRIDEVISLNRLTKAELAEIARRCISQFVQRSNDKIKIMDGVAESIAEYCDNGMRVRQAIEREIVDVAAASIISGTEISFFVEDGKIRHNNGT